MARLSDQRNVLHMIAQDARKMIQKFGPASTPTSRSRREPSPHHHLSIPLPSPITHIFIARGFDSSVAEKFNQVFLNRASSLKRVYEDKHFQMVKTWLDGSLSCADDMESFISATRSAYLYQYNQDVLIWQAKVDEISQRQTPSMRSAPVRMDYPTAGVHYVTEKRSAFKSENIPLLEKAFNGNAYPSRTDKETLSEETGMEYKQVNIWFQNRRARSKKEGVSLQRTATFATQLHIRKPSTPSPSHIANTYEERQITSSPEVHFPMDLPSIPSESFIEYIRPAHTFPTPYPPLYDEESTPARLRLQTPWLRTCATICAQKSSMNIEQLTVQMATLSLSSSYVSSNHQSLPSFALVPPRAPLPALIRTLAVSTRAQPLTTLVSAAGSSSVSKPKETRKSYRVLPPRLPLFSRDRPVSPHSSMVSSRPVSIPRSRARRSQTRSLSPLQSSRSSSASSTMSSRSTSSSWSIASSIAPITPTSASPRTEAFVFAKDASHAPVHRLSSVVDSGHLSEHH